MSKLKKAIPPNQVIVPEVAEKIKNITVGNSVSALQFMNKYGTHYIDGYVTGNSLYQVSLLDL